MNAMRRVKSNADMFAVAVREYIKTYGNGSCVIARGAHTPCPQLSLSPSTPRGYGNGNRLGSLTTKENSNDISHRKTWSKTACRVIHPSYH